jgi:hypothetical protein
LNYIHKINIHSIRSGKKEGEEKEKERELVVLID